MSSLNAKLNGMKWFKHAFAVDPDPVAEPDDEQRALLEKLCQEVVRRRMTAPALLMLEMGRPLNYVSAQFLHFVQPLLAIMTDTSGYQKLTLFLEHRGSVEYICRRLEALDSEAGKKPNAH
jgi:hypothetical protein